MSNNQNQSFLDPKTISAIILSALVFLGWNAWMRTKYPHLTNDVKKAASVEMPKQNVESEESQVSLPQETASTIAKSGDVEIGMNETVVNEEFLHFEDQRISFDISSKGMGLKNIQLKKYKDREMNTLHAGSNEGTLPFSTNIMGRSSALNFVLSKKGDRLFEGVSEVNGMRVIKIMEIKEDSYSIDTVLKVDGHLENLVGVTTELTEKIHPKKSGGMLSADRFNIQEFFVDYGTDKDERKHIVHDEANNLPYSNVNIAAIGSQYFTMALVNKSDVMPKADAVTKADSEVASLKLYFNMLNKSDVFNIHYGSYIGPKSLNILEASNENLVKIIDYGFFGSIARILQRVLEFFHNYTGNWGAAIILLTLLVRFLVLPTALSSYKSMKNMSKINPLLKDIKERHKDDPNARNQAMMQLYKDHKINPVGGCLPTLLQLPVFFALYQVLGQSIDLYQTPFIFWIHDLSAKDPYYVLPVLMGITMLVQTKISPSTMDPAQAKIMMIMPVVFAFMMANLPSGLTLYIFISGLFGIFQQLYFTRDREAKVVKA
ncbi:MAG: membrane protein insertase YidC [Bdellovibrionales bacterium]|nr:membrane protein insertase YidC [Bdellovibrionales bacterium]